MTTHASNRRPFALTASIALAGLLVVLSACADSGHTARPLSPTAPSTASASSAALTEAGAPAVTLTPVAQPAPGPMPADAETEQVAAVPAPTSPDFRVLDGDRLRAATHYIVETATDASADRFWTDLLAQMLDETVSESLEPAPPSADAAAGEATATVLLLRVRVDRASASTLAGASCLVELFDSDRTLATFADASAPARLSANRPDQTEADLGRAVVRFWAEDLAQRLDALRPAR